MAIYPTLCRIQLWIPLFLLSYMLAAQNPAGMKAQELVAQAKSGGQTFVTASLFQKTNATPAEKNLAATVSEATFLTLDKNATRSLLTAALPAIKLELPFNNEMLDIELVQVNVLSDDFKVITSSSGGLPADYTPGLFYRGIVNDNPSTLATLSVFENEVIGLFSTSKDGTLVLGCLKNSGADYILYADKALVDPPAMKCGTEMPADHLTTMKEHLGNPSAKGLMTNCVRQYFEADYALYLDKGSVTATVNYLTGVFNEVATLFANEMITTVISEIYVWDTPDTYPINDSKNALFDFRNTRVTFDGDLAMLTSLAGYALGGRAFMNGLCSYTFGYSYSGIYNYYETVPVYSWTVYVIAHELGHNYGSPHTHDCAWGPNHDEPIDCCGHASVPDPNCGGVCNLPDPIGGGTIMSYCHLSTVGVNFSKGFGPEPGDVMRAFYNNASCLSDCGAGPCDAVSDLTFNCNGTNVLVKWKPVAGADAYKIQYKPENQSNWVAMTTTNDYLNIAGLIQGELYEIAIQTVCASDVSTMVSEKFSCNLTTIDVTCPPDITVLAHNGDHGAHVTWTPPTATTNCGAGGGVPCTTGPLAGFVLMGEYKGNLYYLSDAYKSWENARAICEARGGHLATIESADENQFIASHIGFSNAVHIGLSDAADEGHFKWLNGAPFSYTNWEQGQPDNSGPDGSDYVVLHGWSNGRWADYSFHTEKRFVLELECNTGGLGITQVVGPPNGSFLPLGTTEIIYIITSSCGDEVVCSFKILVEQEDNTGCNDVVNFALGKDPMQSSTRFGAGANRANDGTTNGKFWTTFSVSHTEWEQSPWWEIDLGKEYDLTQVNIWNRTDCCEKFLMDYYLMVSDLPFSSPDLYETLAQAGVGTFFQDSKAGYPTTIAVNRTGRYLRIQMVDQGFLSMAEVEILGCDGSPSPIITFGAEAAPDMNVALHWINNSQTLNDYFLVEKSTDGIQFNSLLLRDGSGPVDEARFYSDLDRNPVEGDNFYRLKLFFKDGSFVISDVKKVAFHPESDFTIFPNPASDRVLIYLDRFIGKEVDLMLVSPQGQVLLREHFEDVQDAIFPLELKKEQLIEGVYSVSVNYKGKVHSKRLVIARFD